MDLSSATRIIFSSIYTRKRDIHTCIIPDLPHKRPRCSQSQRAAGPLDALTRHTHSTGSMDYIWLKHICWPSLNPHLQSSRVKAYFISLGSPLQWQVPHLLENVSGFLLKFEYFGSPSNSSLFPSPVKRQQSPRQTTNNPCGSAGLHDKKLLMFG